jgi:uncharacterized RDD family membrane protein YckC
LSERVDNFRKRRARLQPEVDAEGNLELDFQPDDKSRDPSFLDDALETPTEKRRGLDLEMGDSEVAEQENPPREILPLDEPADEKMQLDIAGPEPEEVSLGEPDVKSLPLEILIGSPTETSHRTDRVGGGLYLAPLGRRFVAGLTDLLVLAAGAMVFGIIFWRFCGRVSAIPLNLAVLGLVAVILVFAYFAVFTAVAAATPGLLWMGCEIRNLRGAYPTSREALWRAFGVLVSSAPLMLGFLWALLDANELTWHDHMSATAVTLGHVALGPEEVRTQG